MHVVGAWCVCTNSLEHIVTRELVRPLGLLTSLQPVWLPLALWETAQLERLFFFFPAPSLKETVDCHVTDWTVCLLLETQAAGWQWGGGAPVHMSLIGDKGSD